MCSVTWWRYLCMLSGVGQGWQCAGALGLSPTACNTDINCKQNLYPETYQPISIFPPNSQATLHGCYLLSLYYSTIWQAKITSKLSKNFKDSFNSTFKISTMHSIFFSNTCIAFSTWIRKRTLQCSVIKIFFFKYQIGERRGKHALVYMYHKIKYPRLLIP